MNHFPNSRVRRSSVLRRCLEVARPCALLIIAGLTLGLIQPASAAPVTRKKEPQAQMPTVTVVSEPERPAPQVGTAYLDRVIDSENYRVGPGDRIAISLIGATPDNLELTITPEATLVIPTVGVVDVRDLTLATAKTRLLEALEAFYPNATLSVSLLEVRHFRVTVVGAVERPGLVTVTANTRASEAIQDAELLDQAAKRTIRLLRGTDTLRVDLVAFLRLGSKGLNPYLVEGDVIQVPANDTRWGGIEISGAVVAPGKFDFVPGDRILDLINLAYGLTANADSSRLELWRFSDRALEAERVDWPEGSSFDDWCQTSLQADDRVLLREVEGFRRNSSVTVRGELVRPGVYVFPGRFVSLREVIDSAGGFTIGADLAHAYVQRRIVTTWQTERAERVSEIPVEILSRLESDWIQAEALSMPGRVSTNFEALFQRGEVEYDLMLSDGDQIVVPEKTSYVNVIGQVVQPGLVAHDPNGNLAYYLERVGGYAWRADRGRTFVLKGGTGAAVKKGKVRSLEPGDIIVVPTKRERDIWNSFKESLVVVANLATIYLVVDQATR